MKKFIARCGSTKSYDQDFALLFLRLFVGFMMLTHGWAKLINFDTMAGVFPDVIGLGSVTSLVLMIFAEAGCSLLLILGLTTRIATVPLIFGMGVAVFVAHAGDPFQAKELALLYGGVYVALLIMGAGRFSLDHLIGKSIKG